MKVMFDCGTHLGEGLTYFAGVLKIDETWKIYAFEANPKTYENLMKMARESEIPNPYIWLQNPNLKLLNVAVWDCESEISFSCGNYDQEKITNLGNDYHNFLSLINERIQEGQLIYNQFDTNLGDDIGHVPDNINVKNPRKIYFNKKNTKSGKWVAPGMNESQICFQSIIINENANPLLFDDTKIKASLTQWSKIGSIRNSIAHTYLVDATTIYSIIAAFKELNRLEFFSKAYVLKNQLRLYSKKQWKQ
jgi:uncharacterized protein with HEPN domain